MVSLLAPATRKDRKAAARGLRKGPVSGSG